MQVGTISTSSVTEIPAVQGQKMELDVQDDVEVIPTAQN